MSWTQVTEEDGSTTVNVADGKTEVQTEVGKVNIADLLQARTKSDVEVRKKPVRMKEKVSILTEAHSIIYGDREKTYGHPAKNLKTIAAMWSAYMNNMDDANFVVTAKDVAAMMMLVKVARFANDPSHRDNLVDVCGYAALIERCDEVSK
jgi:hypothetical protein